MRNTVLALASLAGASLLTCGAASAFPAAPLGDVVSPVEQVRLVCNERGRCWNTGPRYYRYGSYAPRRYGAYGLGYGAYGPDYGSYAPRYGYYGGPGVALGGPAFGLRFGY
jgi:hypothetical protein